MDLINGKYLKREMCAFSGNQKSMWLVVYDGKYNHMLFNALSNRAMYQFTRELMPYNDSTNQIKMVEYYSNFDNAVNNLVKVVANDGFLVRTRVI